MLRAVCSPRGLVRTAASALVLAMMVAPSAVATPAAPVSASAAGSASPARLQPEGRWLVDGKGRTVLLHGVNVVYKKPPWIPPDGPSGFSAADADLLADNGFNVVRLGVLFAGAMPEPGEIDAGYLDQVDRVVRLLAERRIYVLIDFHQDMFTQWPEWAKPWNTALPDDRLYGFPGNYFLSSYLNVAYDNLWADTKGGVAAVSNVRTGSGRAVRRPAARHRLRPDERTVAGHAVAAVSDTRLRGPGRGHPAVPGEHSRRDPRGRPGRHRVVRTQPAVPLRAAEPPR